MLTGTLIGDSLEAGARLDVPGLRLRAIERRPLESPAAGQPDVWTILEFEADDDVAGELAAALAAALSPTGGWYCDFAVGGDHVVVFAGAVFRYARGDASGRARAQAHGRDAGVPEDQLDWGD